MRLAVVATGEQALAQNEPTDNISSAVGENLRRLRTRRGLSLERLSKASNVSRAMLGQIELGRSAPTINLLWKIAKALEIPLSALLSVSGDEDITILRSHRAKWLSSNNGRFASRALFPTDSPRREEFYEARLAAQTIEEDDAHESGTKEHVVVTRGTLEIRVEGEWNRLEKGDAAIFAADRPHAYRNPGVDEALFYVVKTRPTIQS